MYATENLTVLKVSKLDAPSLKMVVFSGTTLSNNYYLSSKLGYIIFLGDRSDTVVPLIFRCYKARKITRSAMTGEVIAFSDMYDYSIALLQDLAKLMGVSIAFQLLTDSKSLFEVIWKGARTSEKCLMLDISAAPEGFRDKIISGIGIIRSSMNVADGLTKIIPQTSQRKVIHPEQWTVRTE